MRHVFKCEAMVVGVMEHVDNARVKVGRAAADIPSVLLSNAACIFKMSRKDGLIDSSKKGPCHSFLCGKGSILSPE